jgi:phosphotransferase family enzyme
VDDAEAWVRAFVEPTGPFDVVRERTWATTTRVPTARGDVWLKSSADTHAFEPRLVVSLASLRPDLLPRVLAADVDRGLLLMADAGTPFEALGNPPELWLKLLPRYAELQRGAQPPAGLPDRRLARWPELFDELAHSELPLEPAEVARVRAFAPRFGALCAELADAGVPDTVQHDDLHHKNGFVDGDDLRIIDWGDSSLSHPFVSLVVTFRFLEELNGLRPGDPWFGRLRDAYLEPWGDGLDKAYERSVAAARFAHAFGWLELRGILPAGQRPHYDVPFATVLRRALALTT